MPPPLFFLFFALFICASVFLIKTMLLYRKLRIVRIKNDCARVIAALRRAIVHYAQRDPALLHTETLKQIAEDFEHCICDLSAKKITPRKAKNIFAVLEKRAHMLIRLYERSSADRADYSDQSNTNAFLKSVLLSALAEAELHSALFTDDQQRLMRKAKEEMVRLNTCAAATNCDYRILYADCALLHVQLMHLTTLY